MKKTLYLPILLVIVTLLAFAAPTKHTGNTKNFEANEKPSCPIPTSLNATKSGSSLNLSWSGSAPSYSYGGYYNYYDASGNPTTSFFGSTTSNTTVTGISIPLSTYSITFSVVSRCSDGSSGQSAPFSKTF